MANPLFRNFGGPKDIPQNKPNSNLRNVRNMVNGAKDIKSLVRFIKSGGSPQAFLEDLLNRNPNMVKQITPFLNGTQNPKQFVMDYCKQNNTTPEELMRQIGLVD